jgi:hypothetical protein
MEEGEEEEKEKKKGERNHHRGGGFPRAGCALLAVPEVAAVRYN